MRIMHAPQHVGLAIEHNARSVAQLRPRSVGFTELDRGRSSDIKRLTHLLSGFRVCAIDAGDHSEEVAIAFREGLLTKVQRVQVVRLSQVVGAGGIGNDRWATVVRFKRFGRKYAHVATHWDAGLQNRGNGNVEATNPRAIAMAAAYGILRGLVRHLIDEGHEVFVTGDFNYRLHHSKSFQMWEFSPQNLFAELGMQHTAVGIDYIAWTPGVALTKPVRVIPQGGPLNLSDHPWLIGTFRPVTKKKRGAR